MPENPNTGPETGLESFCETNVKMAANSNNYKKQGVPRVPSAGHKYYDIATQLLSKAGSDLEELFIAAARDGVYDRIENFLQRNRTEYVVSIDVKDKKTGNTPLIWAAKRGHIKIVQLLLGHGADVTLRNYEGQTAVEITSHSIRSMLLESVERTTEASHQLLLQAAWQGDIQVVSRLLNQKKVLDINCKNADGFTPIMLATRDMHFFEQLSTPMSRAYNPVEVVSSLLSARSDLHATDGDGKTCLHHAAQSKAQIAQIVVATIIAGCPDLEQKDKRCFAPLHCAALTGNADCISTLLDGGSEINSQGFAGATALHITSYNDHEKATSVLLEHGANVTLMDDRGLTPLDIAKTRKMKKKLQEAWTEVTATTKSTKTLAPIRTHSREDIRASMEDLMKKKKKGEVIFEGLPSNPFRESSKKESIANLKGVTRRNSLKEKSGHGEGDGSQPPVRDSVRKLGQVRNQQKPSPLPCKKSQSTEQLPDRSVSDRNLESPVQFLRNSHSHWSFEDKKNGKSSRAAVVSREGTMVVNPREDGLDLLTPGTASPTPSVYRQSESDPNWGTPNLLDIAASCEPYLHGQRKGQSNSVSPNPINDLDINCRTHVQRETTVMSVQRETSVMNICSYRTDSRMITSTNSHWMLNLGQTLSKSKTPFQPIYGPNSSKVLPPTLTFITQRCGSNLDGNSEVDHSPRSDYEMDIYKKLIENPKELPQSKTMYKDEFVLEESCPKTPAIQSSSGTDTISSSSGSSHLTSSPRDSPLSMTFQNAGRGIVKSDTQDTMNLESKSGVGMVSKSDGKFSNTFVKKTTVDGFKGSNSNKINFSKGDKTVAKVIGEIAKPIHANLVADDKNNVHLHLFGVKNSSGACDNAFKSNNVKKEGSKGGGIIHMNGNIDHIKGKSESEQCMGDSKDENENVFSEQLVTNNGNAKGANFSDKTSAKLQTRAISNENQAKANKNNKETSKHMHNVLHVIPSKLTENIIRTAPKGVKETKPEIKDVPNKIITSCNANKANGTDTVHNVNMQLSPSAHHINRHANSSVNDSNHEKTIGGENCNGIIKINENDIVLSDKKTEINQANENAATANVPEKIVAVGQSKDTSGQANSLNQHDINKTSDKSKSAQSVNRQSAPKNMRFSASKSVAVNQMQTANVRKTSSSYTPRFPGGSASKRAHANNFNNKTSEHTNSLNINLNSGLNLSNQNESKTSEATNLIKSASATDLVTSSMCRTGCATKSYNMAAVPGLPKSSSSGLVTSDIAAASKSTIQSPNSNTSEPISVKNCVVSKSTTDALQCSAKFSSTSIVSKSVSQMPNVGTLSIDMLNPKSHFRSSSMSTIEEAKEVKLMSSSDTKVLVTSNNELAKKQRPASDGGAAGVCREVTQPHSNGTAPLVEILPDGAPRINRKNCVDMCNLVSTPVIVNPFEELEQNREKEKLEARALTEADISCDIDKTSFERSKTQVSIKSRNLKSAKKNKTKDGKPSSASTRGSSGKRKISKSKDTNKSDTENSRPKSGKSNRRVRSGRRKKKVPENLVKQSEKPDVALIGGIGWQIATSCIDKSEVDAVIVSQITSSESEPDDDADISEVPSGLHVEEPPEQSQLLFSSALESLSSLYSPHFKEVHQVISKKHTHIDGLPYEDKDGSRPMNLDMIRHSSSQQNNRSGVIVDQDDFESLNSSRAGVVINQHVPDNITEFLFRITKNEAFYDDHECGDKDDYDENEEDVNMKNELHQGMAMGQLTPIPESPSITHTTSTLQRGAKTDAAINRFDQNVNDNDLNMLLGTNTPRDSNSFRDYSSEKGESWSSKTSPLRGARGSLKSSHLQKETKQGLSSSGNIRSLTETTRKSHSNTSHSRSSCVSSADSKDKISKVTSSQSLPNGNHRDSNLRICSGSQQMKAAANEGLDSLSKNKLAHNFENDSVYNSAGTKIDPNSETKERIDSKVLDLRKLLSEKMQSTKKLLEENSSYSLKRKQNESSSGSNVSSQDSGEVKLDFKDLVEECKVTETSRLDDEVKSTRSSRRERKFSETKNIDGEHDEDMMEAIEDILSNNFSSAKMASKLGHSLRSANSTFTEAADKNVLQKMVEINQSTPFHAKLTTPTNKEGTRLSSSFDESVTLNKDNPNLMQRFHAENFNIGQKVKAMIEAGADTLTVKAMVKADEEAKQLAKIRNSFRQMELYAGPQSQNKSSKKETPRKDAETMYTSLSKFDQVGIPPRPGSSGAGKIRGKFTEIKDGKSASHVGESSANALQNAADDIIHSPNVRVSKQHYSDQVFNLDHGRTEHTQDKQMDHIILTDDTMERAISSCSTVSSSSSVYEKAIKWKKGNVLGKGAFGTVWCGLTSEGHLIAVKQIELNTNNKHKAKKEYEKVQEEVELLKTLAHKNIVGYLGTSLEDSIVSIFMQFIPGGSIASILARFGALDESVFRKYTKQILEGMEYLHSADVIHRDIKGGNVMLMPNGVIKLIDFGCAKRLCINLSMGHSQILKSMKGTPYWMAPEVVNETGHGKKSDIWSIGCTVFEMATRKPPWAEMNPMSAIFAIGSDKPVPQLPEKFSEEARAFVNACLTKDQKKRPSATELLQSSFIKRRSKKSSSNC